MLIPIGLACGAVSAWLYIVLYDIGHRDEQPGWLEQWGAFELLTTLLVGTLVFAFLLPLLFVLEFETQTFGLNETVLSIAVVAVGVAGVIAILAAQRRRAAHRAHRKALEPRIVLSNPTPPAAAADADTGPSHPSHPAGRGRRQAA